MGKAERFIKWLFQWGLLAVTSLIVWVAAWVLLWISGEKDPTKPAENWIYEPALVGLSLGWVALASFIGIYNQYPTTDDNADAKVRAAIAGSVVLVFLLLVVDLLTIAGLRDSLANIQAVDKSTTAEQTYNFVEGILDTFKWVVITVVGAYFGAGAVEKVADAAKKRGEAQTEAAKHQKEAARDSATASANDLERARTELQTAQLANPQA